MADKENCVRMTRGAKKRAAAETAAEDNQVSKKRVVLGELPHLSNVVVSTDQGAGKETQKQKPKSKATKATKPKKAFLPAETQKVKEEKVEDSADIDVDAGANLKVDDPQICGAYVSDICQYLRRMEVEPKRRPSPHYIEKIQKDITPSMRGILVDWLVEVAEEYKLVSDTLYLTVSYIDRFLSLNTLNRQRLQLLGVSSMLIASKYEEISPPNVEDFCYITDNTYTKAEVVKMEADILGSLKFELGSPTIKTFLRRFTTAALEDYKTSRLQLEFLGYYLSELSLLDYSCVKVLPSNVAASAIFLARFIIQPRKHPWTPVLQEYTKYKPAELRECVLIMHDLYLSRRGGVLQAVREKYKQHKFKFVANMPSPPEIPGSFFEDVAS